MYRLLDEKLREDSLTPSDYRKVQFTPKSAITVMILRNVSRVSEITRSHIEYFLLVKPDSSDPNIFHVECAPPDY